MSHARVLDFVLHTTATIALSLQALHGSQLTILSDLADYLVRKGVPFRETHHISGQVVALAERKNVTMNSLSPADLQSVDERLGSDFEFDYEKSVEMRTAKGGTSKSCVREQIRVLKGMVREESEEADAEENFD